MTKSRSTTQDASSPLSVLLSHPVVRENDSVAQTQVEIFFYFFKHKL